MEPSNQGQLCWIRTCKKKKTSVWSTTSVDKLPVFVKGEFQMWFTSRKRLPNIKILHIPGRSSSWWGFFTTLCCTRYPLDVHNWSVDLATAASCLKELGINISERLEFQCIPAWVQQKHRGLFARKPLESCIRFDDKTHAIFLKFPGEFIPLVHLQHDAKMRNRDRMTVYWIVACPGTIPSLAGRGEMADELVPIEIEIHPGVRTAPLRAIQQSRVEITRCCEIAYLDGQVEGWQAHEVSCLSDRYPARGSGYFRKVQ